MTQVEVAALTLTEARALTDEIRVRLDDLLPLIKRAYEGRADRALGYTSWHEYCAAELAGVRVPLADRPKAVANLRGSGMSTRAIGSAIGVSQPTVVSALRSASDQDLSVDRPERVVSLDDRKRPATRPTPAPVVEPDPERGEVAPDSERTLSQRTLPHDATSPSVATPADLSVVETVQSVLDSRVPDPHAGDREWRRDFLEQVHSVHAVMRHGPTAVVDRGDNECLSELRRCSRLLAEFVAAVDAEVSRNHPNVVQFRRAQ